MRRWMNALAVAGLLGGVVGVVVPIAPAGAATGPYYGYATGTVAHSDLLQLGLTGPRVVEVDEAFSGATVGSGGYSGAILNEMAQPVRPKAAKATDRSYARGSGLEVGLATNVPNDPNGSQLKLPSTVSEAGAPPSTALVTNEVLGSQIPANPLAYVSVLRSRAQANWNDSSCILGQPISYGEAYAADLQLLSTAAGNNPDRTLKAPLLALDAANPQRAVSQSTSFQYLVSNGDGTFGLVSETHETIAPVRLVDGHVIEFLGEWVLRVTSTGKPGGTSVFYGPGTVNNDTPILRVINPDNTVQEILKFQDIFTPGPLPVPLVNVPGVAEVTFGEKPRAIGGAVNTAPAALPGTPAGIQSFGSAIDVARIKLLEQKDANGNVTQRAADIRVGHMEDASAVPVGGIECPIPTVKNIDKPQVLGGETFTWTISIPKDAHALDGIDCDIVNLSAVDTAKTIQGDAKFTLQSASNGGVVDNANKKVSWANLGPYKPGNPPIQVTITGHADSGAGVIEDTVNVSANLGNCKGGATGAQLVGLAKLTNVTLSGNASLVGPNITAVKAAAVNRNLPRTGGALPIGGALAAIGGALALGRVRRRNAGVIS